MYSYTIQIKYGLPYCVTCPSMSTDPGSLKPRTRRICFVAQVLWNCFDTPLLAFSVRGGRWVAAESGDLRSGAPHAATTTTTTNTSTFNDTSRNIGHEKLNSTRLVGVVICIPQNYTCHQYAAVGKCSVVGWCQLAGGTMETRFVSFFIVKWTMHSYRFFQQSNHTNLHFKNQIDAI